MKTYIYLIIILIVFHNCKSNKQEYLITDVDIASIITDTVRLTVGKHTEKRIDGTTNTYAHRIVPLETNKNSLIGQIKEMKCDKDTNFYILDEIAYTLLKFDKNGKFIYKIDRKGRGPGEYLELSSFTLTNEGLMLYSNWGQTIHYFDCDGNYIKSFSLNSYEFNFGIGYVTCFGDSTLIFSHNNFSSEYTPRLFYFDVKEKIIFKGFLPSSVATKYSSPNVFYQSNDLTFYKPMYENYGLEIDSKGFRRAIYFDFGDKGFIPGMAESSKEEITFEYIKKIGRIEHISDFVFTDNIMFFHYAFGKHIYYIFYSFDTKETYSYAESRSKPITLWNRPRASIGDYFVGEINPINLINMNNYINSLKGEAKENYEKYKEELPVKFEEVLSNVTDNDNPILLLYKIKVPE